MNVTIKAEFAEMTFELSRESAMELIQRGMELEKEDKPVGGGEHSVVVDEKPEPVDRVKLAQLRPARPTRPTRAENMFGSKDTWAKPVEEKAGSKTEYKGFLHIKCEECGKVKSFCAKRPTTHHACECGHYTELKDLRLAHVKCDCGGDFTYKTNIEDREFNINCFDCGEPIGMKLNGIGTTFVVKKIPKLFGATENDPYVLNHKPALI